MRIRRSTSLRLVLVQVPLASGHVGHGGAPEALRAEPDPEAHYGGAVRVTETTALRDGVELGNLEDWDSVSEPLEVTAVSRIRGTQGIQEDTKGHDELGD